MSAINEPDMNVKNTRMNVGGKKLHKNKRAKPMVPQYGSSIPRGTTMDNAKISGRKEKEKTKIK